MKKILSFFITFFLCNALSWASSTSTCIDTDAVTMLHMDGSNGGTTFTDSSASAHTWTAHSATTDTGTKQFGTASMKDFAVGYIDTPDSSDWDLSGAFTIDFWVNFHATTLAGFTSSETAADFINIRYNAGNIQVRLMGGTRTNFAWTPSTSTWYHIAVIRTGSTVRVFVDGTQIGSDMTDGASITSADKIAIGEDFDSANLTDGYIDEFRIVKGTAVWTSNFTRPSSAYSDTCSNRRKCITVN